MPIGRCVLDFCRGTAVTGRIERGIVNAGEEIGDCGVSRTRPRRPVLALRCSALLDEGRAGENVGVLLRGTKRDEVERGQVLAKPGSIQPHTQFECEVCVVEGRGWPSYAVLYTTVRSFTSVRRM